MTYRMPILRRSSSTVGSSGVGGAPYRGSPFARSERSFLCSIRRNRRNRQRARREYKIRAAAAFGKRLRFDLVDAAWVGPSKFNPLPPRASLPDAGGHRPPGLALRPKILSWGLTNSLEM